MISLFVAYLPSRLEQFKVQLDCLRDCDGYDDLEKVLLVDGETNIEPDGWRIAHYPPRTGPFSWAQMWKTGLSSTTGDHIIYMDCDRVFPDYIFALIRHELAEDRFLFCGNLFECKQDETRDSLAGIRRVMPPKIKRDWTMYGPRFIYDPCFAHPADGPGKNPFSGFSVFTRSTFERFGQIDPRFLGAGGYGDTYLHRVCYDAGCEFVDLNCAEIHLKHDRTGDRRKIWKLSHINQILYSYLFGLDLSPVSDVSVRLGLGRAFVKDVIRLIEEDKFVEFVSHQENSTDVTA